MIQVSHLTKKYGKHTAVSDLSFNIEQGHIYGLLGPNGAGKSTTMNIMTGCLSATEGQVKIGEYDIFENPIEAKKLIGYLPEIPPVYMERTPKENLEFVAMAKGIGKKEIAEEIRHVMEVTKIYDHKDKLCKNLSKGYRQRVGIAQAIIGNPEVIILDEPTVGLDPKQIIEIRELIRELGEKHTVILSSHILSEVQSVCDIILILSEGKLVACDTPDNLKNVFTAHTTLTIVTDINGRQVDTILRDVEHITQVSWEAVTDNRCSIKIETDSTDSDAVSKDVFFAFSKAGCPILQMNIDKASLEDIYLELTNSEGEHTDDIKEKECEGDAIVQ